MAALPFQTRILSSVTSSTNTNTAKQQLLSSTLVFTPSPYSSITARRVVQIRDVIFKYKMFDVSIDDIVYHQSVEYCRVGNIITAINVVGVTSTSTTSDGNDPGDMEKEKNPFLPPLPIILPILCLRIIQSGGLEMEGIFRTSGDRAEVDRFIHEMNRGDFSLKLKRMSVLKSDELATLFKSWIMRLHTGIIPKEMYDEAISCHDSPEKVKKFVNSSLPPFHRITLLYIVRFLRMICYSEYTVKNRMGEANVSTVFAPILLQSIDENPLFLAKNVSMNINFVRCLLQNVGPSAEEEMLFRYIDEVVESKYL